MIPLFVSAVTAMYLRSYPTLLGCFLVGLGITTLLPLLCSGLIQAPMICGFCAAFLCTSLSVSIHFWVPFFGMFTTLCLLQHWGRGATWPPLWFGLIIGVLLGVVDATAVHRRLVGRARPKQEDDCR